MSKTTQQKTKSFLEEAIDSVSHLPTDLFKSMTLIRELDKKCTDIMNLVHDKVEQGIVDESYIDDKFEEALQFCDEKMQLSIQAYEEVDRCIRKLDEQLAGFNEMLKKEQASGQASAEKIVEKPKVSSMLISQKKQKKKKERPMSSNKKPSKKMKKDHSTIIEGDMPIDPHEPLYCFCRGVSFGEMIACENPECSIEWFHFPCVGLTETPKGVWYCPNCSKEVKKKKK